MGGQGRAGQRAACLRDSDNARICCERIHAPLVTPRALPPLPTHQQTLSTGTYTLEDVRCRACRAPLGWRYLTAAADDQKYKEGACLLQQAALQLHIEELQPASPEELPPASPQELLPASEALRTAALSAGARLRALEADEAWPP